MLAASVYALGLMALFAGAYRIVGGTWGLPFGLSFLAAGTIGMLAAILAGSHAWAAERDSGAMDSVLLTVVEPRALLRGRFFWVLWPWLRYYAYLLPMYLALASTMFVKDTRLWPEATVLSLFTSFSSDVSLFVIFLQSTIPPLLSGNVHAWGLLMVSVRWLNGLSFFVLALAAAYYCAVRSKSSGQALWRSVLLVPAIVVGLMAIHEGFVLASIFGLVPWRQGLTWIYLVLITISLCLRVVVIRWFLKKIPTAWEANSLKEA
jgi:hypothetical protein